MNRTVGMFAIAACMAVISCGGSPSQQTSQPSSSPTGLSIATGAHILGSGNAKVTIIEFADFQCPYAKSFYAQTESQILSTYVNSGKAVFAYRQFPLPSIHQNAQIAAEASECAAQVGGNDAFWMYHDTLFTKGQSDGTGLDLASLKQYAADLQLDTISFNTCLDQHATAAIVSKDMAEGAAAGVHATPTFFVNGKSLVGAQPFSAFQAAIDGAF